MRVEHLSDRDGFALLGDEWDSVLAGSRQDGPFLRHAWLAAWWDAFGRGCELDVLVCRDAKGALAGALPLYVRRGQGVLRPRVSRILGDASVGSVGLTAFARPEVQEEVFGDLAAELRERGGRDLHDLRSMDPAHGFTACVDGSRTLATSRDCCPRVALPREWETYLGSLSKHMRHEVRRSRRRVEERGLSFEVVSDAAELPGALDDLVHLHELRMRHKLSRPFAVSADWRAFTAATMTTMLAEGRLRLMFLRDAERRLAGLYTFRHGETAYALLSGFDDEAARHDVGRTLWSRAIETAIAEGCATFDMLLGDDRYKFDWGVTHVRRLTRTRVYGRTLAAELQRADDVLCETARAIVQASPRPVREPLMRFSRAARASLNRTARAAAPAS